MEIIAYCNSSCCPSIIINEKDRSQPVLIKDDFGGSLPLTLREFDVISKHIKLVKDANEISTVINESHFSIQISDRQVAIRMIDATGNTRRVKDITFEQWDMFVDAIATQYGAVA